MNTSSVRNESKSFKQCNPDTCSCLDTQGTQNAHVYLSPIQLCNTLSGKINGLPGVGR